MRPLYIFAPILSCLLASSVAYAGGDTDYYPDAPPACGGAFSGFYGGGQLGFGGLNSGQTVSNPATGASVSFNDNGKGFTIGGVAGYNWQCDGNLWGIETDINYFNADANDGLAGGGSSLSIGSEINWFGTLRGRLGFVSGDDFLVYGTAGLAYGGIDHSFSFGGPPVGAFSQTNSDTEIGWTAGGGIEYMIRENWSLRAEGDFVDFGSQDRLFTADPAGGCVGACTTRGSWDDNFWLARVGLTYHFHAPDPVYTPLK